MLFFLCIFGHLFALDHVTCRQNQPSQVAESKNKKGRTNTRTMPCCSRYRRLQARLGQSRAGQSSATSSKARPSASPCATEFTATRNCAAVRRHGRTETHSHYCRNKSHFRITCASAVRQVKGNFEKKSIILLSRPHPTPCLLCRDRSTHLHCLLACLPPKAPFIPLHIVIVLYSCTRRISIFFTMIFVTADTKRCGPEGEITPTQNAQGQKESSLQGAEHARGRNKRVQQAGPRTWRGERSCCSWDNVAVGIIKGVVKD